MLVVRGTKKLRDRVKGAPAADGEVSTTALGDWFATALFWRPQVAVLVNTRTFLPVFLELAPAATLLDRIPEAIDHALRVHGVDDSFATAERAAMTEVRIARALDSLTAGRSTITIAHRLSTAEASDLVVVVDAGEIVETGPHATLVAAGGVYSRMHASWVAQTR
jgi:ABC-type protease/lipase transport system fused ATPase/permease subunit